MNGNDKVGMKQLPVSKGYENVPVSFDDLLCCGFNLCRRRLGGLRGRRFGRRNNLIPIYQRVSKKLFFLQSSHVVLPGADGLTEQ